jgi:hypothetical protein
MLNLESLSAVVRDPQLRGQFGRLATRLVAAEVKAVRAVAALSLKVAQPGKAPDDTLKGLVRSHLDFYGDLIDRSLAFHQGLLDSLDELGRRTKEPPPPDGLSLNLRTPKNSTLHAPFKVGNTRDTPITVACKASPFVSDDGSQLVATAIAFDPPAAEIQPGGEALFDTIIAVGDGFTAGRTYLATLSIEGMDAMRVVLRMTVDPTGQDAPAPTGEPAPVKPPPRARRQRTAKAKASSDSNPPPPIAEQPAAADAAPPPSPDAGS